ncbi:unnamed protein product [Durusdinium trenchii]|uniref:Uncharacterized protein n=1 Tax=Durusdinium trenchii TaxID=1381693 RepID=A0ABP0N539_9DINO
MINAANDGSIVPPDADLAAPIVAGVLAVAAILLLMLYFFCKFCRQDSVLPERPVPPVPPGVPPQVQEHVAAWDPDEEALWIHGGNNGSSSLEDLWKLSSNSWVLVDNMAPARSNHVAVWDTWSSALWIHGGYDGALKSDIWKFDSRSSIWSRIQDTNPPSARAHHVAAFDEIARVIWIHAGYDGSLCQDLWKFDMNTYHWTWVSSDGPSARAYHAAGWDPMNLALWIHGGFDGVALQDLWRFSTLGNTWELIADGGPSPRYNHVAAWDVASLSFVIHGGYGGGLLQDLWRFQASTMTVSSSSTHTSTSSTSTSSTSTSSTTSADFNASIDGLFPLTPATPDLTTCFVAIGLGIPAILLLMLYLFCKFSRTRGVAPLPPPLPPPIPPASLNLRTNTQFLDAPPPPLPPCHSREPMYLPDITLSVAPLSHKADDESCPSQICIEVAPEAELPIDAVDVHVALAPVGSCEEPVDSLRPRCPHRTQTVPRLQEAQNGTARDAPDSSERRQGMRVEQRRVEAEGTVWTEEQSRFSQSPVCLQHVTGDTVTEQWASPNERTLKWSRLIARCYEDKPRKAPEVHRDPQMHRASDAPVNRVSDKINPPQIDRRRKPRFPGRTESAPQLSQPAGNTNATHFGRVPIAADLLPTPPTPQPQSSRLAEPPPRHEREHYPGPAPFLSLGPRGTCHANTFSTREEAAPAPVDGHVVVASKANLPAR